MPSKPQVKRIGHELAAWREASSLSQMALAERAGVNQATISRIEQGQGANAQVLDKLCTIAGIDVHKKDLAYAPILESALNTVWDGSEEQAQKIALLLLAANAITRSNGKE